MKKKIFISWDRFILSSLFLIFLPYFSASADESPEISLTMFLVPANEACRPNGYVNKCPILQYNNIVNFKKLSRTNRTNTLISGDENFSLGDSLLSPIDAYSKSHENPPRASIVMLYDFRNIFGGSKTPIEVKVMDGNNNVVRNYKLTLNNSSVFIDHQRADDFQPSKQFQWTLKAGRFNWKFRTKD
jgi:hypothetical protein